MASSLFVSVEAAVVLITAITLVVATGVVEK